MLRAYVYVRSSASTSMCNTGIRVYCTYVELYQLNIPGARVNRATLSARYTGLRANPIRPPGTLILRLHVPGTSTSTMVAPYTYCDCDAQRPRRRTSQASWRNASHHHASHLYYRRYRTRYVRIQSTCVARGSVFWFWVRRSGVRSIYSCGASIY